MFRDKFALALIIALGALQPIASYADLVSCYERAAIREDQRGVSTGSLASALLGGALMVGMSTQGQWNAAGTTVATTAQLPLTLELISQDRKQDDYERAALALRQAQLIPAQGDALELLHRELVTEGQRALGREITLDEVAAAVRDLRVEDVCSVPAKPARWKKFKARVLAKL